MPRLRVLLASPAHGIDPFCGDVVYTNALLASPPADVEYVPYPEAMRTGELVEHGRRSSPSGARSILLREAVVNRLRARGILYAEPFRHWELRGDFDLVHCHTFSAHWTGRPVPVLFSNALPLTNLYRDARGWSARRVAFTELTDRALARATGVSHVDRPAGRTTRVVAFTDRLAQWYREAGHWPADRIGIVPCFPDGLAAPRPVQRRSGRIGFVAKDFDAKGGQAVLAAYESVRQQRPETELVVVGSEPRLSAEACAERRITWLPEVARDRLLTEILPTFDVLAYPSRMDGLPLVLIEALACGVPCVVSDYFALPEIVRNGAGRVVPGRDGGTALSIALLDLLDPANGQRASRAALDRYRSAYSAESVLPRLRRQYDLAITHHKDSAR